MRRDVLKSKTNNITETIMATKKYIMHNVASARMQFAIGDLKVNVEFKNGNITHRIPASLITNDTRVQMAIESDKRMFGRIIKLEWTHADPNTNKPKAVEEVKKVEDIKPETIKLEDVKNINDVKRYLIENHGAPRNISKLDVIESKVKELGLVFPNFSFE